MARPSPPQAAKCVRTILNIDHILEKLKHPVKAAFFVGTPIGVPPITNNERDNAFTGNDFDWKAIRKKAQYFVVFQSDNDPYVGLDNGKELAKNLGVELSFIPNAGHFNESTGYLKFEKLRDAVVKILKKGNNLVPIHA